MSRPSRHPPTPAHDQHDQLLVAQLVAGDSLDERRLAAARSLVSTCPACADLAADLRLLPRIVAQEPVAVRRRDFRLNPEQAEQLVGNLITRSLRRLSWPRARAFAPAAGAVMSIGLVFIVAGYAWPDDGKLTLTPGAVMEPAPSGSPASGAAPAVEPALESFALESSRAADAPGASEVSDLVGSERSLAAPDGATPDPELLESLPESQAGTSESRLQQSVAAEEAPAEAPGEEAAVVDKDTAASADAADLAEDEAAPFLEATTAPAVGKVADDMAAEDGAVVARASADGSEGPERLLMAVGAALAMAGAVLLLLGWLVRRTSDPLLR